MTGIDDRRDRLSSFLRERRAVLQPADVGLPCGRRRRTGGLRREDVALLAGLSTSWYTALEQGRDVHPSDRVVEDLSEALRLSTEEREYLFALARNHPPPLTEELAHPVSSSTLRLLRALRLPAYVLNVRWDILAWNRAAELCFENFVSGHPKERNVVKILLTTDLWRSNPEEYERILGRVVAKLRLDHTRTRPDASLQRLIDELLETSPTFCRLWKSNLVSRTDQGVHTHYVHNFGPISLENTGYVLEEDPGLRLVVFSPFTDLDDRRLDRILAADPVGQYQAACTPGFSD